MNEPHIAIIPSRPAVCSDAPVLLDVLIRITPPRPEVHFPRAPLNLALVLDRSGSMSWGRKMPMAREAAAFAVQQLLATDRVGVVLFDNQVEVLAPVAPAVDKADLVRRIGLIHPRGSTDLHGGWAEGCRQVEAGLIAGGLNRVLLLSDGQANVGVVDPDAIAAEARGLAARGVGTTTLGVGDDYNEDLMEAMAIAGDGHYYYVESSVQLMDIFQTELQGLMATLGQKVSLGLELSSGAMVVDVLNDFETAPTGRLMLPNLVVDMPVQVVIRLNVPPSPGETTFLKVRLAWDAPGAGGRCVVRAASAALPAVSMAEWSAMPESQEVRERYALLMIARAQKEAALATQQGDEYRTREFLITARDFASVVPGSAEITAEMEALDKLERALDEGRQQAFVKGAKYRSHGRRQSQPRPKDQ